jgi:muramidase (phage lysozyme)
MREQQAKVALALLFIFSLGSTTPLYAESSSATRPLSENCQKASEASGSYTTSVSKILCQEERNNQEVFGSLLRVTNNLTGKRITDLNEAPPPAPRPNVEKPPSTTPPKRIKAKRSELHRGNNNDFAPSDKPHTQKRGRGRGAKKQKPRRAKTVPSATTIRRDYYLDRKLTHLSTAERKDLRRKLEALSKKKTPRSFLVAVERCEGGGLLVVVGGTHRKSADCRRRIRRLNTSGHPKEQGLPNRCFLYTRHGLSTACGKYQIVYYRNWRHLRRLLNLKDFSAKNQDIAALELVRSSNVRGGQLGEGLVALVQGDLDRAIRKGTDPWACSPYSRWKGKNPAPLLQYARQERKKMGNEKYARQQFESLRRANSNS